MPFTLPAGALGGPDREKEDKRQREGGGGRERERASERESWEGQSERERERERSEGQPSQVVHPLCSLEQTRTGLYLCCSRAYPLCSFPARLQGRRVDRDERESYPDTSLSDVREPVPFKPFDFSFVVARSEQTWRLRQITNQIRSLRLSPFKRVFWCTRNILRMPLAPISDVGVTPGNKHPDLS